MPGELIIRHCSPTLAGIKTGNLFNYQYTNEKTLKQEVNHWNRILFEKGICFKVLKKSNNRALIYVYRKSQLQKDVSSQEVLKFLSEHGYLENDIDNCIENLSKRLCENIEFPHEIGVFLGYPLEDIKAFIENKGQNCKCVGCWKVYTNEEQAKKKFAKYKKCTKIYCKKYSEGFDITRLTVAV